ncbi:podocalyxin [Myotis lucifugus]|uniref:podocalyxin n=1 Tax=Myotis lucifugus TaxID=59463 RepID=UPI000CCBD82E|nr:podocalyxin [Myotis lucifugus]
MQSAPQPGGRDWSWVDTAGGSPSPGYGRAKAGAGRRSRRNPPAAGRERGREEGLPERHSGARVTDRPPQPPPGLRARRPSSHDPGARTLRPPRSHLLRARGQGTMRSALALSALLLLLPPLPALSQDGAATTATSTATDKTNPVPTTVTQSTAKAPDQSTSPTGSGVAPAPATQSTTTASTGGDTKADSGGTTTPVGSGQTTLVPTAAPTMKPKTEPTSIPKEMKTTAQAGIPSSVTTNIMTTEKGLQVTTQPAHVVNIPCFTSAGPSLTTSSTRPLTPGPGTQCPPGSSPEGPNKMTTAPGSPGTTPTGVAGTSQGTPTPPAPLATSQGKQPISSNVPAITGTLSSVAGPSTGASTSEPLRPAAASSGPAATPPGGPTGSSTPLAPTAPQDSSIPSSPSAPGNERVKCEPPERLNEKMLILNLTKTSLCARGPGSLLDDKLVTLLCRAAKANFNPSQDQCHIRVVPALEIQAVAIKEITIQTKLLPKDLYEPLKEKWDDLKEVGVSDMQLGGQGPPEETEDRFSMPLIITIVCMASFLLLVAALYGCCHQRLSQRKDQQRLTEELQTVENGYHDNPTLEVMETSSEMQEKKVVNLNGELGDSWIVPLDNLIKDDLDEEEDTHL